MQQRFRFLLVTALATGAIAIIVGAGIFGYGQWSKSDLSGRFVSTDNAQVATDLVQIGSLNAGRIVVMNVDVGTSVLEGQVIAVVDIPAAMSRSDITATTKIGFQDVQDQRVEVIAPRSGVIAARWAKEGDTVPAGQRIVTLMDPRQVWIVANIDEGKIERVRPGQLVEVDVKSLARTLVGRVDTVSPVTAASLSSPQQQSSSGSSRRAGQVVPIKITLDENHLSLISGSTVKIRIHVREPGES